MYDVWSKMMADHPFDAELGNKIQPLCQKLSDVYDQLYKEYTITQEALEIEYGSNYHELLTEGSLSEVSPARICENRFISEKHELMYFLNKYDEMTDKLWHIRQDLLNKVNQIRGCITGFVHLLGEEDLNLIVKSIHNPSSTPCNSEED
jgi:hypothetical protein